MTGASAPAGAGGVTGDRPPRAVRTAVVVQAAAGVAALAAVPLLVVDGVWRERAVRTAARRLGSPPEAVDAVLGDGGDLLLPVGVLLVALGGWGLALLRPIRRGSIEARRRHGLVVAAPATVAVLACCGVSLAGRATDWLWGAPQVDHGSDCPPDVCTPVVGPSPDEAALARLADTLHPPAPLVATVVLAVAAVLGSVATVVLLRLPAARPWYSRSTGGRAVAPDAPARDPDGDAAELRWPADLWRFTEVPAPPPPPGGPPLPMRIGWALRWAIAGLALAEAVGIVAVWPQLNRAAAVVAAEREVTAAAVRTGALMEVGYAAGTLLLLAALLGVDRRMIMAGRAEPLVLNFLLGSTLAAAVLVNLALDPFAVGWAVFDDEAAAVAAELPVRFTWIAVGARGAALLLLVVAGLLGLLPVSLRYQRAYRAARPPRGSAGWYPRVTVPRAGEPPGEPPVPGDRRAPGG